MERDLENLYEAYKKVLENKEESYVPRVRKGEKVPVTLKYLKGSPISECESYYDSWLKEDTEYISFLFGGDMMMIAKWDGEKWISD
jgi:hypothetical protein